MPIKLPDYTAIGEQGVFRSDAHKPSYSPEGFFSTAGGKAIENAGNTMMQAGFAIEKKDEAERKKQVDEADAIAVIKGQTYLNETAAKTFRDISSDGDYETAPQRFGEAMAPHIDASVQGVADPLRRERFKAWAGDNLLRMQENLQKRADVESRNAGIVDLEDSLTREQNRYTDPASPPEVRDAAGKAMRDYIHLASNTGMISPAQAKAYQKTYVQGAQWADAQARLQTDPGALLAELGPMSPAKPGPDGNAAGLVNPINATSLSGTVGGPSASRGPGGHQGVDMMAPRGSQVYAVSDGVVTKVGRDNFGQPTVTIKQDDGTYSRYLHMGSNAFEVGDKVGGGQVIGTSGSANGVAHIHFERWSQPPNDAGRGLLNPRQEFGWGNGDRPARAAGEGPSYNPRYADLTPIQRVTLTKQAEVAANSRNGLERATLLSTLNEDVHSLRATGQGAVELTEEQVASKLGPELARKWIDDRSLNHEAWLATSDMPSLSGPQLAERVAALAPQPGEGFDRGQAIYAEAAKEADRVRKLRDADPAASVSGDPEVLKAAQGAKPDKPDGMKGLVAARLAAQQRIGLAPQAQSPITNDEAAKYLSPLREAATLDDAAPVAKGQQSRLVQTQRALIEQLRQTYGEHADAVMMSVLRHATGKNKDQADAAGEVLGALLGGRMPGADARRRLETGSEGAAAAQAIAPAVPTETPISEYVRGNRERVRSDGRSRIEADRTAAETQARPTPSYEAQQLLLSQPETAAKFDEVFGPGAAEGVLSRRRAPAAANPDEAP